LLFIPAALVRGGQIAAPMPAKNRTLGDGSGASSGWRNCGASRQLITPIGSGDSTPQKSPQSSSIRAL
jgi:hypothetical protein